MAVMGVLFDFSGTLLRVEPAEDWLRAALDETGTVLPDGERAVLAAALEEAGALPGGDAPRTVPPGLRELWRERDRSARHHRAAYTALARRVPLPRPELYEALYERHMRPEAWHPYPDTAGVLGALRERGVPVAVVSNIGWDLRPVFRAHGLDSLVDAYVLSFEHGVRKPEPEIFRLACGALGVPPGRALMVGDDRHADAGAAALGCAVHLVEHLPHDRRPDGLRPVLELLD
ncbi:HAD family hydrolase [Streptomyces sp. TRM 70361]|uniref:HAD family hydrolase n=1 Tax=Streptomyces sp. TRM 70361 TaxID=3116553 RepID=UPI002E7BC3A0|nr:HAD family hydrolase [Streptomyces sp. TRM 70361]MEE1940753.1 HAD family hydrolase [Streptomyces sp. TRM 70361]